MLVSQITCKFRDLEQKRRLIAIGNENGHSDAEVEDQVLSSSGWWAHA